MTLQTIELDLPETIDLATVRFGVAAHLIHTGSISLKEALLLAGMERRPFIKAMLDLGGDMAEAIEDAVDIEAIDKAKEEDKRLGLKPIPFEEVLRRNGMDYKHLPSYQKYQKTLEQNEQV